jgi:predicted dehydrogenase
MLTPVRLGVIGCGVIGQVHLRLAQSVPGAHIAAICDAQAETLRTTAQAHPDATAYSDPAALLADPGIDAVILALPAHLRTALGVAVLRAGKHLLTEKPVALNADEVRQLIAARGDRVAACTSSRLRFLPSAKAVTAFVASGALGRLRMLRCRDVIAAGPPPDKPPPAWRLNRGLNGGGILVNWGCYDLDYLFGITGWRVRPQRVLARHWQNIDAYGVYAAPGSDAETHVSFFAQCDDGIALTYERGEFMPTATDEIWQLIGDTGALRMNMKPSRGKQIWYDQPSAAGTRSEVIWEGDEDWETQHRGPLADFVEAIQQRCEPATTLEHALLIQSLTDAVYASASADESVSL